MILRFLINIVSNDIRIYITYAPFHFQPYFLLLPAYENVTLITAIRQTSNINGTVRAKPGIICAYFLAPALLPRNTSSGAITRWHSPSPAPVASTFFSSISAASWPRR